MNNYSEKIYRYRKMNELLRYSGISLDSITNLSRDTSHNTFTITFNMPVGFLMFPSDIVIRLEQRELHSFLQDNFDYIQAEILKKS